MVGKEMQMNVNKFRPWEDRNCVCLVGGIKCTCLVLPPMEGKKKIIMCCVWGVHFEL